MSRSPMFALVLLGCVFPEPGADEATGSGGIGGAALESADGLQIWWEVEDRWEGGACVRMEVASTVGDLSAWQLEVELDRDFQTWIGGYGAAEVQPRGARAVSVSPFDGALSSGARAGVSYCTEPAAVPVGISGSVVLHDGGDASGGTSGAGADGSGAGTGGDADGSLSDGSRGGLTANGWGLEWQASGSSNGGDCVEYTLVNLTDEPLADWWAQVILDGPATVTDSWGVAGFTFDTHVLWLLPPSYEDRPIEARGSVTGTVCLEPFQEPIGFNVFGDAVDPSGDSGDADSDPREPEDIELSGELYDASEGWVIRYEDGGSTATEHCVNLMVANLSGMDATSWTARIGLDSSTVITRDWSFEARTDGGGATLDLVPESYAQELGQGDVVWGGFCMNPVVTPVSLSVEAVY